MKWTLESGHMDGTHMGYHIAFGLVLEAFCGFSCSLSVLACHLAFSRMGGSSGRMSWSGRNFTILLDTIILGWHHYGGRLAFFLFQYLLLLLPLLLDGLLTQQQVEEEANVGFYVYADTRNFWNCRFENRPQLQT